MSYHPPHTFFMISYFQLFLLLPLLITPISSSLLDEDDDNYIGVMCPEALEVDFKNYSNFIQNVVHVVDNITINAPKEDGFKFATYSYNGDPVFGLAQCRVDVHDASCSTCLNNAVVNMRTNCPNRTKGAVVVHDKCFLMYSDQDFFGQPYAGGGVPLFECDKVSKDVAGLKDAAGALLHLLNGGTSRFEKGSTATLNGSPVDAIVECRRDLGMDDCIKCLSNASTGVLNTCYGKALGKYNVVSCNVRYEGE